MIPRLLNSKIIKSSLASQARDVPGLCRESVACTAGSVCARVKPEQYCHVVVCCTDSVVDTVSQAQTAAV